MRVSVAILAVFLGGATALAQGSGRESYGPVPEPSAAKPEPDKAEAKPAKSEVVAKPKTEAAAKPKGETAAKPEPVAKPKAKTANAKPANAKPADAPVPAAAATNGTAPPSAPVAKPSALQDAYAAISLAERVAIQNDLTWGGDFTGPIDGEFSERLVAAVKAYQTRHKNPVTGVLSADERAALAAAVEPRKEAVGWKLADDPVTGARLGVPAALAPKVAALANGTRWSSEQGQLQIETFRIDTGATLDAVFEQQKKVPRRKLASSAMQGDSFTITGMQGLKKMVVRGFARDGEVRGLIILYDQAMEGTADPLVAPLSSAYVPFPGGFAVAGAVDTSRRKVEYGTGVFVSSTGHLLTDRRLIENCNVIALPGLGNAERVATDPGGEIALLRLYGAKNVTPMAMIGGAMPEGPGVTLVGIADPQAQGGGSVASVVSAKLNGLRLESSPALGFGGAVALDAQGRVGGMVAMKSPVVAGPGGPPQATVVPVDRLRNFLEANYVAPASGDAGAEAAKAALTRVICVRK